MPEVQATLHPKFSDPEAMEAVPALATKLNRFRFAVKSVSVNGFVLVVTTTDNKGWDLTADIKTMPLAAKFVARANFPQKRDVYGVRYSTEIYTRGCHWIPRMFA
jgi:hypothetical protein